MRCFFLAHLLSQAARVAREKGCKLSASIKGFSAAAPQKLFLEDGSKRLCAATVSEASEFKAEKVTPSGVIIIAIK